MCIRDRHAFGADALGPILDSLVRDADAGEFRDYVAAEQASMAVQSVVVAFQNAGALDADRSKALQGRVDAMYATVERDEGYDMSRFVTSLRQVRAAAR